MAGAHILKYIYNKLGIPASIPGDAECSGWYHSADSHNYNVRFYNYSSDAWTAVNNNSNYAAAVLIDWIAHNIGTEFGSTSGAYSSNYVNFLHSLGISCNYTSYNGNIAFNRVFYYNEPVYIDTPYVDNDNNSRHAIVMDRAKKVTSTLRHVYEYVPYNSNGVTTGELKYEYEEMVDKYVSFKLGWEDSDIFYDDIYVYITYWNYPSFQLPPDDREFIYNFTLN